MNGKDCHLNDFIGTSVDFNAYPGSNVHGQIVVQNSFGHHTDFSQNIGIMNNNNLSGILGTRISNTQIPNPLNNGDSLRHHPMTMPNHIPQNPPNMGNSLRHQPMGLSNHMPQNPNTTGNPLQHYPMGLTNLTPQNPNANGGSLGTQEAAMQRNMLPSPMNGGNPFVNQCSQTPGNPLQYPAIDSSVIGIQGRGMTNVMASEPFNGAYFTENDAAGMQGLLTQDMMNDNSFSDFNGNFFPQDGFAGLHGFHQNNAQGVPILPQDQQDTTNGHMRIQGAVDRLQAELQGYQDKIFSLEQEHAKKVATLQQRIAVLQKENVTLSRENVIVKGFYNMLRGYYDFIIGPGGRLFPVIPDSNQAAVVERNKTKPQFQQAYEDKMERIQRQYKGVVLGADICFLCPVHHSSHMQLQAPEMRETSLQFVDLTGDAEPSPARPKDTIQEFLARAARQEVSESSNPGTQATAAVDAAIPAQVTTAAGTTSAAPAIQPTTRAATTNAASFPSPPTGLTKRPASPTTLSSPAEDASPSKRQKRKQSDYGWMQPSQNLALRKATGDLPHPLEEWNVKQVAAAVNTTVVTTQATNYPPLSLPPNKATAPEPASASSSPKTSKVTKTKPTAPKKSNSGAKGKKPKSSTALSADLTKALSGTHNTNPSVANPSSNTGSYNALSVEILPEEPTYVSVRIPTPPLLPTASPTVVDPESEPEEDIAAHSTDYDLTVIDHNEQDPLLNTSGAGEVSPFEADDDDVANIIALLEAPEEFDDPQNEVAGAKNAENHRVEKGTVQGNENEVPEDNEANEDENWDADSLFAYTEEELQAMWRAERSEESEESEEE